VQIAVGFKAQVIPGDLAAFQQAFGALPIIFGINVDP
jgi:hypothetical protein